MLAIALRALLLAMAACASMADFDGTLGPAHAHSLHPKARTLHTTSMDTDSLMHTITRRNSALSSTLLSIAARTHVIVMVAQTQRDELILMVCCDGKSQNARLHALRAKSAPGCRRGITVGPLSESLSE